jgi:hypothetical protein
MRKWLLGIVVGLCALQGAMAVSIGEYRRQRDSVNVAAFKLTRTYLTGVVAGYIWANAHAAEKKAPLLFCQPPPITADLDVPRLMDEEIGQINVTDDYPAELVLLEALIRAYPCDSLPDSNLH